MKDAKHHLKHLQKKVIQSAKKDYSGMAPTTQNGKNVDFKRPKTVLNRRKFA